MIALDTNVLVHAHREDAAFHERAAGCVAGLANAGAAWAIPWPCLHEFFAIVTHPRIYVPPSPQVRALDQIEAWLESPSLVLLGETEMHWPQLKDLLVKGRVIGALIHDARIAALCLQHGVKELWSADRDFGRFTRLKVVNPLVGD